MNIRPIETAKMREEKMRKNINLVVKVFFGVLLIAGLILILSNVSSTTTNYKTYNPTTKTASIYDSSDTLLAEIELRTPIHNKVHFGYQKVAEFKITNTQDSNLVYDAMKFYDMKNSMTQIDREFEFKILENVSTEVYDFGVVNTSLGKWKTQVVNGDFTDYLDDGNKLLCKKNTLTSELIGCDYILADKSVYIQERGVIGSHFEDVETWVLFDKLKDKDLINSGDYIVGIFTYVFFTDYVEWVPTFFGVEITEWADWSSLDVSPWENVQVFNSTGADTFTVPAGITEVSVLVVAGGGGGGDGGGGAGGLIYNTSYGVTPEDEITIGVGGGGGANSPGGNSVFGTLTAIGGGEGGTGEVGANGGSGGGGGSANYAGGTGTAGQGNNGGSESGAGVNAGGGGGAGAVGANGANPNGGDGGAGTAVWGLSWAGGGGGCTSETGSAGSGGTGGGGDGGAKTANAVNGVANTGGGGGGAYDGTSGSGGSGVVIVVWNNSPNTAPDTPILNAPTDDATGQSSSVLLNITISDPEGDDMNVTFYNATSHSAICTNNTNIANASDVLCTWTGLSDNTDFQWYANVTDGAETTMSSEWNFSTGDNTNPTVAWYNQNPADINVFNTITTSLNVTYNITDAIALNLSTIKLYYKFNDTTTDDVLFINGTPTTWFQEKAYGSNVSNAFKFTLNDNELLAGTYNINEELMEGYVKSVLDLDGTNEFAKVELLNVSTSKTFNFLELYVDNQTASSPAMNIFYCNSTYSTGNPTTNGNCAEVYSLLASETFSHVHSANSKHYLVPLGFSSGTVGGVTITPTSYFLIQGGGGVNGWNAYYTTNKARLGATQTSGSLGASWSELAGTLDLHIHQFNGTETLYYYACANDTSNNQNCTSLISDAFDLTSLAPSGVDVFSPISTTYAGTIAINWTSAVAFNGAYIEDYNITLLDENQALVEIINGSTLNTTLGLFYDTTSLADGTYLISITGTDNNSLSSTSISQNFTLDNTAPTITTSISDGADIYRWGGSATQFNFTYLITETNFDYSNYTFFYPNGTNFTQNSTAGISENTSLDLITLGVYTWDIWAFDTLGNYRHKVVTFTLDLDDGGGGASRTITEITEEEETGVVQPVEEKTWFEKNKVLVIIGGVLIFLFLAGKRNHTIVEQRRRRK